MDTTTKKFARLRKDLLEKVANDSQFYVTVGGYAINTPLLYEYKWKDEDNFQIKIKGKWYDAQSADFDFPTQEELNRGTYRVTWEIDIDADTPKEAAQKAFYYMQKPDTTATVFKVENGRGESAEIDLLEEQAETQEGEVAISSGAMIIANSIMPFIMMGVTGGKEGLDEVRDGIAKSIEAYKNEAVAKAEGRQL